MATTYDVIKFLSQAAANSYDGAQKENYSGDGKAHAAGLQREEGEPLKDRRVIDGFNVGFHGDSMVIKYHTEVKLREVADPKFQDKIEGILKDLVEFLKKEYKTLDSKGVSLTPNEKEARIVAETISSVRSWVIATRSYKIGGLEGVVAERETGKRTIDEKFRKFLDLGGLGDAPANSNHKGAHKSDAEA